MKSALNLALSRSLDLVEVSPNSCPPVCKLMDYGKYKYLQRKRDKASKKKVKGLELKEVKMRPKIESHDLQVKASIIRRILAEGNKVKIMILFRGREMDYAEASKRLLEKLIDEMTDMARVERKPDLEGKTLIAILAPK